MVRLNDSIKFYRFLFENVFSFISRCDDSDRDSQNILFEFIYNMVYLSRNGDNTPDQTKPDGSLPNQAM